MNRDDSERPPAAPRFPLNRVLTLLGPYIAIVSGGAASWLSQNFPGLVDNVDKTTQGITQGTTFVVGAVITWALQHKYLEGWQRWEGGLLAIEAAQEPRSAGNRPPTRRDPRPIPERRRDDERAERRWEDERAELRRADERAERRLEERPSQDDRERFQREPFTPEPWQREADQPFAFDDPGLFDTGFRPPERG